MSTNTPRLLTAFAACPGPLAPAAGDALVALAAAAAATLPEAVLCDLVARPDLSADQARRLPAATTSRRVLASFLCRPDVSTVEVLEALARHDAALAPGIAAQTTNPTVLAALATSEAPAVLKAVLGNPATAAADAAQALAGALRLPGEQSVLRLWLVNPSCVATAVIDAWAPGTTDLDALTLACGRPDVAAATLTRLLGLAAAPTDPDSKQAARSRRALQVAADHPGLARALTPGVLAVLRTSALLGDDPALARRLGVEPAPRRHGVTGRRSWQAATKKACKDPEFAAALLHRLADLGGDRAELWPVLARLAPEHTGTVAELVGTAASVAAPAG